MMASIAIVLLNCCCMSFANHMTVAGKDFGESIPVVCIKDAAFQVFYLIIEPSERCSITTADNPGHSSPRATIHGLNDPFFVFFLNQQKATFHRTPFR